MNEIKGMEIEDFKDHQFMEIKPETDLTLEDARKFWDDKMSINNSSNFEENLYEVKGESDGYPKVIFEDGYNKSYYDNGNLYRIDKDLLPDTEYTVNGYDYKTDYQGRIIEASGKLHLKEHPGYKSIKDSLRDIGKGDENKETDEKGHLIGDQFGGKDGLENAIPQDANLNKNDYKNLENSLAKQVADGKDVRVQIEPQYEGKSHRPMAISFTYSINGEQSVRIFPNRRE